MKRKHNKARHSGFYLLGICLLIGIGTMKWNSLRVKVEDIQSAVFDPAPFSYLNTQLTSEYALLVKLDTQEILLEKRKDERIYPASMTKIMTTYVALQKLKNLDLKVLVPSDTISEMQQLNASMAGFRPMEEVSIRDLLYGAMLPSGAEACVTLAQSVSGSEQAFVDLMNTTAAQLGMKNTHFMNTTGLHEEQHYSTVQDIEILLSKALQDQNFKTVFTTQTHRTQSDAYNPNGLIFTSTLTNSLTQFGLNNPYILGAKTGYTPEAGLCMASLGKVGQSEYVLISARAKGDHETDPYHVLDALNVYKALDQKQK